MGTWLAQGSERFYLLLPFAGVALLLVTGPGLKHWRSQAAPIAVYGVLLLVFCTVYGWQMGGRDRFSPRLAGEAFFAFYFLVGITGTGHPVGAAGIVFEVGARSG
jgi:hypothetical protein